MQIASGSFFGPYVIASPIGAGGMGEVHRARDTRLNRDVALKVLAPRLGADAAALARFEREAQALAALSHPNIVAIYDVGRRDDSAFVVMEFLEGETLRARMTSGPVPLRKALEYAVQMAHALGAAHARGIVHRDLKPENIFLTNDGRLKVLDFGLAQLASASAASIAETVVLSTNRPTSPGTIVGTVGYLAPEQARGHAVDARADIFSFGAVLYELISGRRAFAGDTAVDVLAAILHTDPPELAFDERIPAALDRIVRRCLEKRPEERFQSAHDVAFALDAVASGSNSGRLAIPDPVVSSRRAPWWAVAIAAAAALVIGLVSGYQIRHPPAIDTRGAAVRFMLDANRGVVPEISISPDGRYLAWTALANGGQSGGRWVRKLDASQADLLRDTPSSGTAFWSSDGREVVVLNGSRLTAVDVERGNRRILLDLDDAGLPIRGGDWTGQHLLLSSAGAIWLMEVTDVGSRTRLTTPDARREVWHGWPMFLGDGRRFVYTAALTSGAIETRIASVAGGEPVRVALPDNVTRVRYDTRGYLVFGQNGALMAQHIDPDTGKILGSPIRVSGEVLQNPKTAWAAVDVSRNGVLAWRAPGVDEVQFEWVDRAGRTLQSVSDADSYTNFDLSPDGNFIATTRRRGEGGGILFLIDTRRNITTPISDRNSTAAISDPTWSPDGRQLVYRRGSSMVLRNAFGGEERTISEGTGYPDSWSRDGRFLIVGRPHGPSYELWAVAMNGTSEDIPLVTGLALADEPRFSPDGRWVIFHASVQAGPEVYAIAFPPTGERWQISSGGGVQPRWRADGRELYYLSPAGQVMAVSVPDGDPRRARTPEPLFNLRFEPSSAFDQFTPVSDGQRFLVRRPLRPGGADTAPVHVLVNWSETLPSSTTTP